MNKLLAVLIAGLFATGAFAQATPAAAPAKGAAAPVAAAAPAKATAAPMAAAAPAADKPKTTVKRTRKPAAKDGAAPAPAAGEDEGTKE